MNHFYALLDHWDDMRETLNELSTNSEIFANKLDLKDTIDKFNSFFKTSRKEKPSKEIFSRFYSERWALLNNFILNAKLPSNLTNLMTSLICFNTEIEKSTIGVSQKNDYYYFATLLSQVSYISDMNNPEETSNSKNESSEIPFDFFPAIFVSIGIIKRQFQDSDKVRLYFQNFKNPTELISNFKNDLSDFEKLMKEVDKVNFCKRLYLVMEKEFQLINANYESP